MRAVLRWYIKERDGESTKTLVPDVFGTFGSEKLAQEWIDSQSGTGWGYYEYQIVDFHEIVKVPK